MSHTGTLRTAQPTSSTDKGKRVINLHAPQSWNELSQEQLRYVLWLMVNFHDHTVVKTYMFCRFCGIEILKKTRFGWKCRIEGIKDAVYLKTWQVHSFLHQMDYIDTYEDMDCRLDALCGFTAVDVLLHGVDFGDYLNAEKYYQGFIINKDDSLIDSLACLLYVDEKGENPKSMELKPEERLGTTLWYSHIKFVMSSFFPHFFKKAGDGTGESIPNILEQYNVQMRALTGGDITKEDEILHMDCWRALTELDAKAREAEELEKIRKKK